MPAVGGGVKMALPQKAVAYTTPCTTAQAVIVNQQAQ